jgi:hypothetical protein
MRNRGAILASILLGIGQLVGVCYAALVVILANTAMTDDGWAAHASDADWWALACRRLLFGLLVATFTGGILLVMNHVLARWRIGFPMLRPPQVAWISAAGISAASLIGAIDFFVVRPYM